MTEQHPLTDAICEELADTEDRPYAFRYCRLTYIEMINMRAAADWQLEQVVQWIEDNLLNPHGNRRQLYVYDNDWKTYREFDCELIDRLTQAMRPTQEDN